MIDEQTEAVHRIRSLSQGFGSVAKYWIEFNTWAPLYGWGRVARRDPFRRGLNEAIKDRLINYETPEPLESPKDLAIKIDHRLTERQQERRLDRDTQRPRPSQPPVEPVSSPAQAPEHSTSTSMDLDAAQIPKKGKKLPDAEKQRRRENGLCLYRGGSGHVTNECPQKGKRRDMQAVSVRFRMTQDSSDEDPDTKN